METLEANRQSRGLALAKSARIKKVTDSHWLVPSASHAGTYVVDPSAQSCTCPDHEERRLKCKHIWALEYARHQHVDAQGNTVVQEVLRVTYTQNWTAYNAAQTNEKEHVGLILKALCSGIVQPSAPSKRGRPRLALADVVYSAVMKTFTGFSGRRATTDIRECAGKKLIDRAPHYNSIFSYFEKPELTPLLESLIAQSASPLKAIETNFAVDSTGFATSTYYRWFDHKYGREQSQQKWLKAHAMTGVATNIVTAVRVTPGNEADCPELPGLVETTRKTFQLAEVSADKAYLSHKNLAAIEAAGAEPYIPFKENSRDEGSDAWRRMWCFFVLNQGEFLRRYHRRSNVESTFFMVKKKFGSAVRAKTETAQINEVLCKFLCHNLSVLVHAFYELGADPVFYASSPSLSPGELP